MASRPIGRIAVLGVEPVVEHREQLMLEEGARVIERAAADVLRTKEQSTVLTDAAAALRDAAQARPPPGRRRRDGLRRGLPDPDPPHRPGQSEGPRHSLRAEPDDPGSPCAIGSADGGHDAIHPDLGTFDNFDAFAAHARRLGLEVALDLALNCAPDHPWVAAHPEWFTTRADGSIAYAENPPKKYQDIYPLNFDNDPEGLYAEIRRVVRL
jgi:hypothetical protein